jgi:hypothetical protein
MLARKPSLPFALALLALLAALLPALAHAQPASPPPAGTRPYLGQGQFLRVGELMVDREKSYFTVLAGNATLCTYTGARPGPDSRIVGCANAAAHPPGPYFLIMQADGNLCIYRGSTPKDNKGVVWCARNGALPQAGYFLEATVDGDLVVWNGTPQRNNDPGLRAVWSSAGPKRIVRNENTAYWARAILYGPRGPLNAGCIAPGAAGHVRVIPLNAPPGFAQANGLGPNASYAIKVELKKAVVGGNCASGLFVCESPLVPTQSMWQSVRLADEAAKLCAVTPGGGPR